MGASGRQNLSAMPRHIGGEQHEQDTGEIRSAAGYLAKAAKALLRMAHAPGRGRIGRDHREGETKAEGTDHSARRGLKSLVEKLTYSHTQHCIEGAQNPAQGRKKLRALLTVLERYVGSGPNTHPPT